MARGDYVQTVQGALGRGGRQAALEIFQAGGSLAQAARAIYEMFPRLSYPRALGAARTVQVQGRQFRDLTRVLVAQQIPPALHVLNPSIPRPFRYLVGLTFFDPTAEEERTIYDYVSADRALSAAEVEATAADRLAGRIAGQQFGSPGDVPEEVEEPELEVVKAERRQ